MTTREMLVVSGAQVRDVLADQRDAVMDVVRRAYVTFGEGKASPPKSQFLRFPGRDRERIIALPAYLGGEWELASLKWIASFPNNTQHGLDRASATLVINDLETGYPLAMLESSTISAWRTAASAATVGRIIHPSATASVGVIGCGLISYETVLFLRAAFDKLDKLYVYDLSEEAARSFAARVAAVAPELSDWEWLPSSEALLETADVTVLGTTAINPHISAIPAAAHPRTILHVSLRDLAPSCLLGADNTADDITHVNQARTSVHLLSEELGHVDFMRSGAADLISGAAVPRADNNPLAIFHPFGLGMLDLAVGAHVLKLARERGVGVSIPDFIPAPWRG